MGRWTQYDEDSYRLPSGFKRVGYDADTGEYVFQSASGDTWNGAPHETYGNMHRTSPPAWSNTSSRALDNNSSTADSASTPEKSKPAFRRQLSLRFLNVARSSGTKEGKEEIPSNSAGPNMFARTAQTVVRRMRSFSVPASAVGKRHTPSNEERQLAPSSYTSERKVETVKRSATLTGPSGENKNPGSENETARPTHSGNGTVPTPNLT
ncbi:hypothetical protein F5880DRAFT_6904 [Lentinula raphanica]|nr:hypothetical protein F5880DRAFT_6904 [Lentinula raphanica]